MAPSVVLVRAEGTHTHCRQTISNTFLASELSLKLRDVVGAFLVCRQVISMRAERRDSGYAPERVLSIDNLTCFINTADAVRA